MYVAPAEDTEYALHPRRAVPSHCVDPPSATVSTKPASCDDPLTLHLHAEKGIGYPNTYATAEQAEKNPAAYQLNCGQSSPPQSPAEKNA